MKRWMVVCFTTLSLLTLVVGSVASPDALAQGNSANAKACQKGGWATRARTEDPGAAFVNQDECVSYGAQGGTIVRLGVTPRLTMTVRTVYSENTVSVIVTGVGLGRGSVVGLERSPESGDFYILDEVEQDGSFSYDVQFYPHPNLTLQCGEARLLRGVSPSGAYVYGTFLFDCPTP